MEDCCAKCNMVCRMQNTLLSMWFTFNFSNAVFKTYILPPHTLCFFLPITEHTVMYRLYSMPDTEIFYFPVENRFVKIASAVEQ